MGAATFQLGILMIKLFASELDDMVLCESRVLRHMHDWKMTMQIYTL